MAYRKLKTIVCSPVECPTGCKPGAIFNSGLELCNECICEVTQESKREKRVHDIQIQKGVDKQH